MNCKKEQVWQVRPGRLYLIVFLQNGKTRCNGLTDPNIDWKHYAKLFFAHQDLNNVIRVSRGLRPKLHNLEVRLNGPVFWFKLTQTLYRIWHPFQIPLPIYKRKGESNLEKMSGINAVAYRDVRPWWGVLGSFHWRAWLPPPPGRLVHHNLHPIHWRTSHTETNPIQL